MTDPDSDHQSFPRRVVVLEDNHDLRLLIAKNLERLDWEVHQARNAHECQQIAEEAGDCILLLDFLLPEITAEDVLDNLDKAGIRQPFIIMTGHGDEKIASRMMRRGAKDYLVKGMDFLLLLPEVLRRVFKELDMELQLEEANRRLSQSEEQYRNIIENSLEGIYVIEGSTLRFCNSRFAELFGAVDPEELVGQPIERFIHPESLDKVREMMDERLTETPTRLNRPTKFTGLRMDGSTVLLESQSNRVTFDGHAALQGFLRDISEQEKLEQQLKHAQKMENLGKLASGIAHDFNNLLTAIMGDVEFVLMSMDKQDPHYRDIEEIAEIARRGAELTSQLLATGRRQAGVPEVFAPSQTIRDMENMLRRTIREDITLSLNLPEQPIYVEIDKGQFEQVIMNLVVNARDAITGAGEVTIRVDQTHLNEKQLSFFPVSKEGSFVRVSIQDTGSGIPREVMEQMFEPFFTTKKKGEGTGLGLATVYGIVTRFGGFIDVKTELEKGSTFHIYLPETEGKQSSATEMVTDVQELSGTERLFIVEDEAIVRRTAVRALERFGYNVQAFQNAENALAALHQKDESVDLVITDVVMPGMNGFELIEKIRESYPEVQFLLISGYTEKEANRKEKAFKSIPYLQKPFKPLELVKRVRRELDQTT